MPVDPIRSGRRLLQTPVSFDPAYVNNFGLCGKLYTALYGNGGSSEKADYDSSGLVNGGYGTYGSNDNTWFSTNRVSGTHWARVYSGRQRWNGGVILGYSNPESMKNFEIWIGDDANFPGTNTLCYKSTVNIPSGNNFVYTENFGCDLSGSYIFVVRRNMVNEFLEIGELGMYKASSYYGQIVSGGTCVCPIGSGVINGTCTPCPIGNFSAIDACENCPSGSTTTKTGSLLSDCSCKSGMYGKIGTYVPDICSLGGCKVVLAAGTSLAGYPISNIIDGTCNSFAGINGANENTKVQFDFGKTYFITNYLVFPGFGKMSGANATNPVCTSQIAFGNNQVYFYNLQQFNNYNAAIYGCDTQPMIGSFRATNSKFNVTTCLGLKRYLELDLTWYDPCLAEITFSGISATCNACPVNNYCSNGDSTPCPSGSTSAAGSTLVSQCICSNTQQLVINNKCSCPSGKFLSGENCLVCPVGMVCAVSEGSLSCSSGSYCPEGSIAEEPCQAGYFCPTPAMQEQCPANTYCLGGNTAPVACQATYVSPPGSTLFSQCEVNVISVAFTIDNVNPNVSQSQFQAALPANVAVNTYDDIIVSAQTLCPTGYYCPADTTVPIACPAGKYNDLQNQDEESDCKICPAGQYCPINSTLPTDCAAGSYQGWIGGVSQASCTICPSGNYCPAKSVNPTNCTAGTYEPTTGGIATSSCLACPAGDYCPIATTTPSLCSAGSYRGTTGGVDQGSCTTCPSGNYCPIGAVDPTNCSAAKYRLTEGGTSESSCDICPSGNYCPLATTTPINCPAGTYRATDSATQLSDCLTCPAGQFCPQTTTTPTNCAGGSYRGTVGGVAQGSCTTCPSGNYCPSGAIDPTNCTAGTYNPSSGQSSSVSCITCPSSNYCPLAASSTTLCAINTFSASPGKALCDICPIYSTSQIGSTNCTCDAGHFHNETYLAEVLVLACPNCSAGYRSSPADRSCTSCGLGYYSNPVSETCTACPAGTKCPIANNPAPVNCGLGYYQSQSTQSVCLPCPAGKYCDSVTTITPTDCPAGTFRSFNTSQALVGSDLLISGASLMLTGAGLESCLACPVGKYCEQGTVTPVSCAAGSYRTNEGAMSQADCTTCPVGEYCPISSVTPTDCYAGTYNPDTGKGAISDCQVCFTGKYSLDISRSIDCPLCQANSYCSNSTSIKSCPVNTVSAAGSSSLLHCRCDAGFKCSYTKKITAVVTLNTSVTSFNDPNNPVRAAFIAAVAAAAGVSTTQVTIGSVVAKTAARRLLSSDDFIDVHTTIDGATRLHKLDMHLAGHSATLHQGHTWQEAHMISSHVVLRRPVLSTRRRV